SAANDCVPPSSDGAWTATGPVAATIIIELAAFAPYNVFGIYDVLHPDSRVTVFGGAASSGAATTFQLVPNGAGFDVLADNVIKALFASGEFVFFLSTPLHQSFFSQSVLNGDGGDHMYASRGNNPPFTSGSLAGTLFATSIYLLAFKDLPIP